MSSLRVTRITFDRRLLLSAGHALTSASSCHLALRSNRKVLYNNVACLISAHVGSRGAPIWIGVETTMAYRTLLLVEDDVDQCDELADQFRAQAGFGVSQAYNAVQGIEKADSTLPDLILLDVDLPDMDGRDACRVIRRHNIFVPILMLSGYTSDADAILGLNAGANAYVFKPIKFDLLLARVKAHINLHEGQEAGFFHVGPYRFSPSSHSLVDSDNRTIVLTTKETAILQALCRANGKRVSRQELIASVWGTAITPDSYALEAHLYRLRHKIEPLRSAAHVLHADGHTYWVETSSLGADRSEIDAVASSDRYSSR